jgi:GT2 family glycosyltransferase
MIPTAWSWSSGARVSTDINEFYRRDAQLPKRAARSAALYKKGGLKDAARDIGRRARDLSGADDAAIDGDSLPPASPDRRTVDEERQTRPSAEILTFVRNETRKSRWVEELSRFIAPKSALRAVDKSAREAGLYLGKPLTVQPLAGVQLISLRGLVSCWSMVDTDPGFLLSWRRPQIFPAGTYRLTVKMRAASPLTNPVLYIDSGEGFTEAESCPLTMTSAGLVGYFRLTRGARALRLDPSVAPGPISFGRVQIRRLDTVSKRLYRPRTARAALAGDYQGWIKAVEQPSLDLARLPRQVRAMKVKPLISVVMPVYNPPESELRAAILSVVSQSYPRWELCIADDRSTEPHVRRVLREYEDHPQIRIVYRERNGHISAATNSAFELAAGEWVAMLDHDDILPAHALAEVALEIGRHPDTEMIYSDEDKIDAAGQRFDPYFKPDFSRELFRSQNYLNHLTVHRAANIKAAGGWRRGFEGSQDYDLNLRIFEIVDPGKIRHIPKILYHWRASENSVASGASRKNYAVQAGLRALREHVGRQGLAADVETTPGQPFYRVRLHEPKPAPLVSLIIPTRDHGKVLRGCVESILRKTTYRNFEILVVDNGSTEPDALRYLAELRSKPNIRVLDYPGIFNFSAINNFAVARCRGSVVGLVNNDMEIISPGWLSEMVSWTMQSDVGCVGAKLYYPNDTLQHAGVILGIGGVAGHSHKYFDRRHPGYFSRLSLVQNLSAVTGACLLTRKAVYEQIGGLDEKNLAVAFNDVDFCLKIRSAGYNIVWTPYAELYHHESLSRGHDDNPEKRIRFDNEVRYMKKRWDLKRDPFYSPHLTLTHENFAMNLDV